MQIVSAKAYLTKEERQLLHKKNDLLAAWEILIHWLTIAAAFALVYIWPNIFTILVSLFLLGGKQLACAILMHDAGHFAIFKSRRLNDWVGKWLGAYPIFNDMTRYRSYHFEHHKHTGLEEDPDLLLTRGYPTSRKSMIRKFTRDLTGQTGIKAWLGLMMIHLGYLKYNLGGKVVKIDQGSRSWKEFLHVFVKKLGGPILANLFMLGILSLLASPFLYLLWIVAYLTTFQFCLRVRSIAEHSVLEDSTNPLKNTRTTYANWFERILFAPYHVNYHAEHHMLMTVPSYNLPKMHKLLKARKFYEEGVLAKNYWEIIKMAGLRSRFQVLKPSRRN